MRKQTQQREHHLCKHGFADNSISDSSPGAARAQCWAGVGTTLTWVKLRFSVLFCSTVNAFYKPREEYSGIDQQTVVFSSYSLIRLKVLVVGLNRGVCLMNTVPRARVAVL